MEFEIRVPKGVKVGVWSVNGGVSVDGVSNEVRAGTVNGSVEASSTGGPVQASTVNGSVRATMGRWDGDQDLTFSSVNGSVVAEFTGDIDADIDLSTVNGRFQTDWPVTISGRIDPRRLRATLGKGGRRIRLSTVNGNVELRKRQGSHSRRWGILQHPLAESEIPMGVSYTGTLVRTGTERATLVKRTYGLVFVSVIVTMIGVAFCLSQPSLFEAVARHPFISMIAMFAPLWMALQARRSFPRNIILTLLFTFIEGIVIAPFLALAETRAPGVISQAGILTLSTFGVLTLYAAVSKRDFSAWGSFFIVGLWVLIATSLLNMFFQSAIASLWIAGATVLVFSGLLVFDTWRILRSGQYGQDDYVAAAVNIYLDLLNLFLALVSLLGGRRR